MRQQMVKTIENLLTQDERLVLLLADVSTSLFENAFHNHPQRALNLGILKQTMTSVAAGLALEGFIPVLHTQSLRFSSNVPFDAETLRQAAQGNNIIVVEPYYAGVLVPDISVAMQHMLTRIEAIGVPHELLTHYGTPEQHDEALGLTPRHIRARIQRFLGE